jgi:hypothetical protein
LRRSLISLVLSLMRSLAPWTIGFGLPTDGHGEAVGIETINRSNLNPRGYRAIILGRTWHSCTHRAQPTPTAPCRKQAVRRLIRIIARHGVALPADPAADVTFLRLKALRRQPTIGTDVAQSSEPRSAASMGTCHHCLKGP